MHRVFTLRARNSLKNSVKKAEETSVGLTQFHLTEIFFGFIIVSVPGFTGR
jgi:hypothetical protein